MADNMKKMAKGFEQWRDEESPLTKFLSQQSSSAPTTTIPNPQMTMPPSTETMGEMNARQQRFQGAMDKIPSQGSLKDVELQKQKDAQSELEYLDAAKEFEIDPKEKAQKEMQFQKLKQLLGK